MDYEIFNKPDKTFNTAFKISVFIVSCIAFFVSLENLLSQNNEKNVDLINFIIFLGVLLIVVSATTFIYYFRKYILLKRVKDLPFKMIILFIDVFAVGILCLISYISKTQ